jgi:hypothetical protein
MRPAHLTNRHRDTLDKIFQHPIGHNIEWKPVLSLLDAVGTVEERHDRKFVVTVGSETRVFERPRGKDVDVQDLIDLRRILSDAGYRPTDE